MILKVAERLRKIELGECFDPITPGSRPTAAQLEVLKDAGEVPSRFVTSGNQCLAKGTMVATPVGPIAIEDIEVGDRVLDENGNPIEVLKTYTNGIRRVVDLLDGNGNVLVSCTRNHVFLVSTPDGPKEMPVSSFSRTSFTFVVTVLPDRKEVTYVKVGKLERLEPTYDIHVASEKNLYLLANGLVTHNSGKSQLAAREIAWALTETHPHWKRPARIGSDKLQILCLARIQKHIEEITWKKISSFLNPEDIHIQKTGGAIQTVTYKPNGNKIIFLSHHNANEAREKSQAFTADWVWLDELPSSFKLIEELQRRVQARDGRFLATFTPKTPNKEIRDMVDNLKLPYGKKYQFSMLDNPIYDEKKKAQVLHELETFSEAYRRTILYGDWFSGDSAVYQTNDSMIEAPPDYSPAWRHVESLDPALSSKFGVTIWAESPSTGIWYCIRADELPGTQNPLEMLDAVHKSTQGLNIVRRISDPEANWYTGLALTKGLTYLSPNKVNRKHELIKNLQIALSNGSIRIAPWCDILIKELETCQWSETVEGKIVNSSSFHVVDAAQYFVDMRPKGITVQPQQTWHEYLRIENTKRKKTEAVQKKLASLGRTKWRLRRG
jgi:phage terminase large subunit-like protein